MKKKTVIAMIGIMTIMTILSTGCGKQNKGNNQQEPTRLSSQNYNEEDGMATSTIVEYPTADSLDQTLQNGVNQFAYDFAGALREQDKADNYFFSPYSLCTALTLLDNGADGKTLTQINDVMGVQDLAEWNKQLQFFMNQEQPEDAIITSANSLWVDLEFEPAESFYTSYLPLLDFYYQSELYQADFKNKPDQVKDQINQWVSDHTDKMIPEFKKQVDPGTVLSLINAVYFYGEWTYKFDATNTWEQTFHGTQGDTQVEMMHDGGLMLPYYLADGLTGLSFPYGDGSKVMNFILSSNATEDSEAAEGESAESIFMALSDEEKTEYLNQLMHADAVSITTLNIPKFTMEYSVERLPEILQNMGMTDAFDSALAKFDKISDSTYVSDVSHTAKLEVDEEGSRAAAVTEITVAESAMEIEQRIDFILDQPFLFFIQDKESGVILFMGSVNNL